MRYQIENHDQQVMQIYEQGLKKVPNSCLLHVGKAYLFQNEHFLQYHQSVMLYQTAIQLCGNNAVHTICKVNVMFDLANLLIDHDQYQLQHANSHNYIHACVQYLTQRGCKHFIKVVILKQP